jgi:hypothetical protein
MVEENMIYSWNNDREDFDGRSRVRGGDFSYDTLFKHFSTLENLNKSTLLRWGVNCYDGSKSLTSDWEKFTGCHYDAMKLYMGWKNAKTK